MKLTFLHKGNDLKDKAVARSSPADLLCETVTHKQRERNQNKKFTTNKQKKIPPHIHTHLVLLSHKIRQKTKRV